MCHAAPFSFVAELSFEVRPHVIDATQLLGERVVRGRYYVVLLLQGHQHLLHFKSSLAEQVAARDIARIKYCRMVTLVGRGTRRKAAVHGDPAGAVLGACRRRNRRDATRGVIGKSNLGRVGVESGVDELKEGIFGGKDLSVDFFQQGEVSDEVFRESSNSVGEVRNSRKYLDRLLMSMVTAKRLSAA